mmetsp:Transcript_623/g.1468  ORF Transcript_623/g.1468 Transcript_623/m.1468 type:complete len:250 (-) Transcript_623:779-1528(-)
MEELCLPVDVIKAHFAVPASTSPAVTARWKVSLLPAVDFDMVESGVELRRSFLHDDADRLPRVLGTVLQRRLASVDLESGRHVGPKATGEVQANEEGNGLARLLHDQLTVLLWTRSALTRQLRNLKVALVLAPRRHDAPDVEVRDARLGIDDHLYPLVERLERSVRTDALRHCHEVSRVLLAPTEDMPEVIGRAERHLGQSGKAVPHLLIAPDETITLVCQPLVLPPLVSLQCQKDHEEHERPCAVSTA